MPGRVLEAVGRVPQVLQEVAEEQRLAVLLQADDRVELRRGLVREHRAQELDRRRRHLHVDEEVGAVRREQERELHRIGEQRIDVELASRRVADRDGERVGLHAVDDAPDDVGRAVAEEQARQHLDLEVRLEAERPRQARPERAEHVGEVAAEVAEAALEAEVEDQVDDGRAQAALARVVRAIGGQVGVEVLGRHRGPHEQRAVVEVVPVQELARDRVEERLGALGLPVLRELRDVLLLDPRPQRLGRAAFDAFAAELAPDPLGGLGRAPVVEVDAVAGDVADREEMRCLEMTLRGASAFAEERVVLVEAFEHRLRDRLGGVVAQGGGRVRRERTMGHGHASGKPEGTTPTIAARRSGRAGARRGMGASAWVAR